MHKKNGKQAKSSRIIRSLILLALFSLRIDFSQAGTKTTIEPIGPHYPLFIIEKSENPQNVLVPYTKLDAGCRLLKDGKTSVPLLDYYWLMDRKTYKPVHPMIKSGIRGRIVFDETAQSDDHSVSLKLEDLTELKHDLGTPRLIVEAVQHKDDTCEVVANVKLGPSDAGKVIRLTSIFTESKFSLVPPFRTVVAVTLKGTALVDGASVSRRYVAR